VSLLLTVAARVGRRDAVIVAIAGVAVLAALVVPSVAARSQAVPVNTTAPTVTFPPGVGNVLTPTQGTWSNSPSSFTYQWLNCPGSGGGADGSGCFATMPPDANLPQVLMEDSDLGRSWRARVTATNASGSASAVSAATQPVTDLALNITGCPDDEAAAIHINQLKPAARLIVGRHFSTPAVITRATQRITLRIEVDACDNQPVIGALVYVTPTPFNQFTTAEQPTNTSGVATLTLTRLRGFPATSQQQNLVVFVRATKPGQSEDLLGNVSGRRLVSFPVRL
jgi:hypothetical protein